MGSVPVLGERGKEVDWEAEWEATAMVLREDREV